MTGEVQQVHHKPLPMGIGGALTQAGQEISAIGARTNYPVGVGCIWGGYGFGGIYPVPGYGLEDILARTNTVGGSSILPVPGPSAQDIYDRQKIGEIMFGNGVNSTGANNGVTTGQQEIEKTTNPADVFNKIEHKKIEEMAQKERDIKDLQDKVNEEQDKNQKEELSKQLVALQTEYKKLDKELGGGKALSKTFGDKEYSFYANIQPEELTTIKDINSAISKLKEDLAKLDKEGVDLNAEMANIRTQLKNKSGGGGNFPSLVTSPIDDKTVLDNMSPEKRDRMSKLKQEREDKITEISEKITQLKNYITNDVLKDDKANTNFYTSIVNADAKAKSDAQKNEGSNIAKVIDDMYTADGKLKTKEDVKKELDKIAGNKYKEVKEPVFERLYALADGKSKDEFKKALEEEDFFTGLDNISLNDKNNYKQLALLQEVYNNIVGSGKFEANGKKYLEKRDHGHNWENIADAIKRANETKSDGAGTSVSVEETTAKVKSAHEELQRAKRDAMEARRTFLKARRNARKENATQADKDALTEAERKCNEATKNLQSARAASVAARREKAEALKTATANESRTKAIENKEKKDAFLELVSADDAAAIKKMDSQEVAKLVAEHYDDIYTAITDSDPNNDDAAGAIMRQLNDAATKVGIDKNSLLHFNRGTFYDNVTLGSDNLASYSDGDIGDGLSNWLGDSTLEDYKLLKDLADRIIEKSKKQS